jgi:hypothetical protein
MTNYWTEKAGGITIVKDKNSKPSVIIKNGVGQVLESGETAEEVKKYCRENNLCDSFE